MQRCALSQEFVTKERLIVILEAVEGLEAIRQSRPLRPLETAALEALRRVYYRVTAHAGTITDAEICRPLAVAHRAIDSHV